MAVASLVRAAASAPILWASLAKKKLACSLETSMLGARRSYFGCPALHGDLVRDTPTRLQRIRFARCAISSEHNPASRHELAAGRWD